MRTKYSFLNIITAVGFSLLVGILSMFRLKFFIGYFGDEINGFFSLSNSISLAMTFVEAGMGGIFITKLYHLLANDNKQGIVNLYSTVRKVAMGVTAIIFAMVFVYSFIHTRQYEYLFGSTLVFIVYWLYMMPTIFSYYLRVPTYILMADQHEYIVSFIGQMGNVISYLLQILLLIFVPNLNILTISIIMFVFTLGPLLINHFYALHHYSYLRKMKVEKNSFDRDVITKMKDCFFSSVSNSIMQSVDTVMLAYVANESNEYRLSMISIISIYNGIILLVKNVLQGVVAQVVASFGNLAHTDKENFQYMYKVYIKISFAVCCAMFASVYAVINKFNTLFYSMGSDRLLTPVFVLVLMFNALMDIVKIPLISEPVNIRGKYNFQRNVMIIEAISNIVLSYVLLQLVGVIGLFVATAIVQIISVVILIPRETYRNLGSSFGSYLNMFGIYLILFLTQCFLSLSLIDHMVITNVFVLFIAAGIILLLNLAIIFFISFMLYSDFYVIVDGLVTKMYRNR